MELQFVVHEAVYSNAFEALLANGVKEFVLTTLLQSMSRNDTIEIESRRGDHVYELIKVYQRTISEDETFVLISAVEKFTDSRLYGLWIAAQTEIALFEVNHDEDNWWVNISVDGWGKRWLPWAQKVSGKWLAYCKSSTALDRAIKIVGQSVDEYAQNRH